MSRPGAIVVGAGIGGLAAALDLACRGIDVTVHERAGRPGGKMREIDVGGHRIDSGPTVFTMPWVFESLFADAGTSMHDQLDLRPVEVLARHAWSDGGRLDLFADPERSADAIRALSGEAEARRFRAFCAEARKVYETLYEPFIRSQRPGPASLVAAVGLRGLLDLWRIRPFETLWHRLGTCFRDPRLQKLFARYATYCGSSPLQAPATLMLIAHVEQCGVWQIAGGMQRLAEALAAQVEARGGVIHYGSGVHAIETTSGKVTGVRLESGALQSADVVITNADVAALRGGRLGAGVAPAVARSTRDERSLSAVTWSLHAETSGFELAHHNVFFPDDYPKEFDEIFTRRRLPTRPAVYVCAQDRGKDPAGDDGVPVAGPERLFLITNAPACGDRERFDDERIERLEAATFGLLADCGLGVDVRPGHRVVTTPADFEQRFPGTGGALYGSASHGWRASFSRPGARSRIGGLYLAGGSVHPGAGVPMVAMSGRLAAEAVAVDLGLAARP